MIAPPLSLNVLLIEDNEDDAQLVQRQIERHGYRPQFHRVDNEAALRAALDESHWDVVLSDFSLPSFSGVAALRITHEILPDVPFILVSGAIGEELAVDLMRNGAQDYVMKGNLARLGAVLDRELEEAQARSERRINERLLHDSEERFRSTFEQLAVGLLHVGADGRCLRVNERFCAITGFSREEAEGRHLKTFMPPESHERLRQLLLSIASGEVDRAFFQEKMVTRSGAYLWADITASLAETPDSGERYLVVVVEDVTARVAAADALRESESRYRLLLEQASDGIIVADEEGNITDVNESMCAMTLRAREEIVGFLIESLVAPDDLALMPMVYRQLERNASTVVPRVLSRPDGSRLHVEVSVKKLSDGRIQAIVRDMSERIEAEEQLRLGEMRFRLVTAATNDAIYDWNLDSGEVWRNENFFSVFGYQDDADDVHRVEWWSAHLHPDDRARVEQSLNDALRSADTLWSAEYRMYHADGTYRYVIDRGYISRDAGNGARRVLGSMLDITERRASEGALRASEARFRHIFEANMLGIYFWNFDGRIHGGNDRFLETIGFTRAEMEAGKINWKQLRTADRRQVDEEAIRQLEQNGVCDVFETVFVRQDGVKITVLIGAALLSSGPNEGVAFITDVSDRKRAEDVLRESEERFRALFENATDAVAVVQADGTLTFQSPSIERMIGYAPEEMVGTSAFAYVDPVDRDRVLASFMSAVRVPGAIQRLEYGMIHKNGSVRQFESVGKNLVDHETVHGIVVTTRDITERKQIEGRLEQAQRLSSLGRLSASVAHEFNNVMMGIQMFSEVISRQSEKNTQLQRASEAIRKSIERGRLLTQDILRFAQPAEPTLTAVDVREWILGLEPELRGLLGQENGLTISAPRNLLMFADTAQLTQVITNLTLNARDAMRERPGVLRISADHPHPDARSEFSAVDRPESYVQITVRDEGAGIAPAALERIFEPLFTTKRNGTGLGLAIAHQIVQRHTGHIFVDSREGVGTTFHLFIPRSEHAETSVPVEESEDVVSTSSNILLVEDDAIVADGLAALLTLDGFGVRIAPSVQACRAAIEEQVPDAIVLDVGLPDGDGLDLAKEILAIHPSMPIVFATGHGDESRIEELAATARVAFLQKPCEVAQLEDAIREVMSRRFNPATGQPC